jgi:hypothetical protein
MTGTGVANVSRPGPIAITTGPCCNLARKDYSGRVAIIHYDTRT